MGLQFCPARESTSSLLLNLGSIGTDVQAGGCGNGDLDSTTEETWNASKLHK